MIPLLAPDDPRPFPDVRRALRHPNGLLAVGADLSPRRLMSAYRQGIFPWFSAGDPILWWSPDPRTVLLPGRLRISRSLGKRLRRQRLGVTMDRAFAAVIRACAAPRGLAGDAADGANGTWILPEMIAAYEHLHRLGISHSVEVWDGEQLVGGLYGVAIGQAFFGESMFSRAADASKVALVYLCQTLRERGFGLIDCQMRTEHLLSLGAQEWPRREFVAWLECSCAVPGDAGTWDDGALHFPVDRPPVTGPVSHPGSL
ncbi:leucyl/phenylalanyl-tRNA--protein transferase [uncultured Thiodictyon sp.]|uniref:leucyl/phenylalanyl-tRNA--protein transferase n=1 Tax=uncultured Thiodictyon sp. TaxID=1846217 RepID=UPI0025DD8BED|nr:leucyl/phenylalanyl-tRNA--protein transferase [uncultured Thiodictyon sp.]